MKQLSPTLVINHGHFFTRTLLTSSQFVRHCKDRDIEISEERLEKFEKLGIFFPVLRVARPEMPNERDGFPQREDGDEQLDDKGQPKSPPSVYADFIPFDKEYAEHWIAKGFVCVPTKGEFTPWSEYIDSEGTPKVQTYYSIFQTLPLYHILQSLSLRSFGEDLLERTEEDVMALHRQHSEYFTHVVQSLSEKETAWEKYAKLCLVISCRYLPFGESDGVTIAVPAKEFSGFDFFEFRQNWDAQRFLDEIEITVEEVIRAWEGVTNFTRGINPLLHWEDLVDYVKRDKREKLKGLPLLLESWKVMSKMLSLFHEDLTGQTLFVYGRSPENVEIRRGKGINKDDLRHMEFISNEFGVNPRPKLILVVEGDGEMQEVPRLAKWAFGNTLAAYRIQLINLGTIGEFNSAKIERFIDHFHDLQTIVYFVLDNENRSRQVRDKLIKQASQYYPDFTITKGDLFTIWDRNTEFDNFSDSEIADAMSELCDSRYLFQEREVKICRESFPGGDLARLYKERLNYGLKKIQLLEILFRKFRENYRIVIEGVEQNRPLVDVLFKVRAFAIGNHQPSSLDTWTQNQHSGWLRTPIINN